MDNSIIRTSHPKAIGLALLSLFLTYSVFVILGGPLAAVLGFCVFGIAWFAAVTSDAKWIRVLAMSVIVTAFLLVIAIAGFFWAAYG